MCPSGMQESWYNYAMMDLQGTVERTLARGGGLPEGARIVVGVSGGPDSLCLLHLLKTMATEHRWRLHVAHLNHCLRAKESDEDARFVAELAKSWGLPATVEAEDVARLAEQHRLALEEAARQARYAFLARVAAQQGSRHIAVAHTADDQAETVLMHLLRGAGLAGLRGMLVVGRLSEYRLVDDVLTHAEGRVPLLWRPLLDVSRDRVEAYCREHGLHPRFDRSNLDTTFYRNRLRHELIPNLRSYNPAVKEVLCRTARVLADDYAFLHDEMLQAWGRLVHREGEGGIAFDLKEWRALPPSLARAMLREAVRRMRQGLRNINLEHIERAYAIARDMERAGSQATLPQGLILTVGYEELRVTNAGADWPPDIPQLSVDRLALRIPGVTPLPGSDWWVDASLLLLEDVKPGGWKELGRWEAMLDWQAMAEQAVLRVRQPGDRFQPLGMGGSMVKLNEFFINSKVDAAWRGRWPLLEAAFGIAWVPGLRPDERARVRSSTRAILHLRFMRGSLDESPITARTG